ncbi:MAG: TetR/AcrR family transcriptional regulator [Actinobacteria bacterium]|nr:TetR/AcrR family transcriptional regulator [Actinomycetota bacterium]
MNEDATPQRARGGAADPEQTKQLLLDAALRSLADHGYAGTTARGIAAVAGTNPALINYHFGGMRQLLVAALARSNEARLARYREATAEVVSVADLIRTWEQLHDEDVAVGHIGALVALLGATSTVPELRGDLSDIFGSWQGFVEEKVSAAVAGTPLGPFLPTEQAAFVILALFVGVELLTGLDGNEGRAAELFRAGDLLAGLLPDALSSGLLAGLGGAS